MDEIDKLYSIIINNANRCNALMSESTLQNETPTLIFKKGVEEEYYYLQRENQSLMEKIRNLSVEDRKAKGIRFDFGCVN